MFRYVLNRGCSFHIFAYCSSFFTTVWVAEFASNWGQRYKFNFPGDQIIEVWKHKGPKMSTTDYSIIISGPIIIYDPFRIYIHPYMLSCMKFLILHRNWSFTWFNLVFWFEIAYKGDDGFKMKRAVSVDDRVDVFCMTIFFF